MASAVVLLSGGLDSSTALAITAERGFDTVALTFSYGQRHLREVESARGIARHFGVSRHIVIDLDIGEHLRSSLTQHSMRIPQGDVTGDRTGPIPSTYVPARNIIFMSVAAAIAESIEADRIVIAANSVDFSGYPDCTLEFVDAYQRMLEVGTRRGVEGRPIVVDAPLLRMSKAEIVREALRLAVPLGLTWSCYSGGERACGTCDSCRLRLKGFREAGADDPVEYEGSGEA
jgi:7-cyano-7-deazaguanine synthase